MPFQRACRGIEQELELFFSFHFFPTTDNQQSMCPIKHNCYPSDGADSSSKYIAADSFALKRNKSVKDRKKKRPRREAYICGGSYCKCIARQDIFTKTGGIIGPETPKVSLWVGISSRFVSLGGIRRLEFKAAGNLNAGASFRWGACSGPRARRRAGGVSRWMSAIQGEVAQQDLAFISLASWYLRHRQHLLGRPAGIEAHVWTHPILFEWDFIRNSHLRPKKRLLFHIPVSSN